MHWAATGGHLAVLDWLVQETGCDVNARNKVGRTPLMFAAKYGHAAVVRWLIESARADPALRADDDSGAFDWAVYGADIATLEAVAALVPPEDIHAKNKFGCTAVHWASSGGDVTVLQWLYVRGLDFSVINSSGHGAVQKASWRRHKAALEWLIFSNDGPQLLWQCTQTGSAGSAGSAGSLEELVKQSVCSVEEWLEANAKELRVCAPA